MFNQGMVFRNEKPCLIGTEHQLTLASESFRWGLYGFYSAGELADCGLSAAEIDGVMREIEGLSLNGIQPIDELLELVPLVPLQELPSEFDATCYNGVRIWKEDFNVFGIEYQGHRVSIDCTLPLGEEVPAAAEYRCQKRSLQTFPNHRYRGRGRFLNHRVACTR